MSIALKEMDRVELVNLERLVHISKGLSAVELEALELLLDEDALRSIERSLKYSPPKVKTYKKYIY